MGNTTSRPVDDETMGIADLFHVKRSRKYRLLPPFLRRLLVKLRLAAHARVPTTTRQRGLESIDSMGEMRCYISAMGGWEEERVRTPRRPGARRRQSTFDSVGGWVGVYSPSPAG